MDILPSKRKEPSHSNLFLDKLKAYFNGIPDSDKKVLAAYQEVHQLANRILNEAEQGKSESVIKRSECKAADFDREILWIAAALVAKGFEVTTNQEWDTEGTLLSAPELICIFNVTKQNQSAKTT